MAATEKARMDSARLPGSTAVCQGTRSLEHQMPENTHVDRQEQILFRYEFTVPMDKPIMITV